MPKPRQVGGLQEVFIQTSAKTFKDVERAIKAITGLDGRILHAFPPSVIVASVPTANIAKLSKAAGVASVFADAIGAKVVKGADRHLGFAMSAWNEHVSEARLSRAIRSPLLNTAWDAADRMPPDPPKEIMQRLREREMKMLPRSATRAARAAGAPVMSIPVLVGRIAVGIIYVDSTVSAYQISDTEKLKVLGETTEGLNMLAGFEPRANIQWFYDIKRPKISLASSQFTTANQDDWENKWRNAAMQSLGYAGSITGMNSYIQAIKTANSADWAYAVFVTKYPKDWFAYQWGNHVVMDFGVDGWGIDNFSLVVAHETGHVFGCPDEYAASGCNCTSLYGRYQVPNGNCENCASPSIPCLMSHNSMAMCDYTRGHLGWNELAVQSRGTTTLKGTWTFDLDTGVQGPASGADLWWRQMNTVTRYLVPQSGAMLAHMGKPNFDAVSLTTLKAQSYTTTPINGSNNSSNKLKPGTVIAVRTGAGRYAKLKINSYGYNLGISWVTYK